MEESHKRGFEIAPQLTPEVIDALLHAAWPGNIRDLRSLCQYLVATSIGKAGIEVTDLPASFIQTLDRGNASLTPERVRAAIERVGGNREAAAKALGITPRHLYRILSGAKQQVSRNSA
jgi:two-component system response regulator HydG